MTTAVFASTLADAAETPSKPTTWLARVLDALVESRARTAAKELRRYEALLADLERKQDHSSSFLMQDKALPVKV
jgi:hypothetical protein